jgi:sugar O-acyltransferase (sialic acid O-acetyltransferase NeuD family)
METEKKPLIIIGASGHAKVVIDIFLKSNQFQIPGLLDDHIQTGTEVCGLQILGKIENMTSLLQKFKNFSVFIAIGDNWTRHLVVEKLINMKSDLDFATAIHPSVQIGMDVKIGKGVAIMAGAVVNSGTIIEDFGIINTNSSLDHDCQLGKFSSLAPGVTIGGNVKIGAFSAVSLGANILHGKTIGNYTIVGAGSLVLKDVNDFEVVYGVPAKLITTRLEGEKYL